MTGKGWGDIRGRPGWGRKGRGHRKAVGDRSCRGWDQDSAFGGTGKCLGTVREGLWGQKSGWDTRDGW